MFVRPLLQVVANSLPGCGTCGIFPSNGFWMNFLLPWFVNVPWSCLVPSLPRFCAFSLATLRRSCRWLCQSCFCSPCVLRHHVGSLLLYVLPYGCPPSGCCDASPRLFRLQPHSGPFLTTSLGLFDCLNFVLSFLRRFLLSQPLRFHMGGTGVCIVAFGLLCAWLAASLGFACFLWYALFCEWFYLNHSIVTYPAWYLAVSLPGSCLCYGFSLSFSCLLCHKD